MPGHVDRYRKIRYQFCVAQHQEHIYSHPVTLGLSSNTLVNMGDKTKTGAFNRKPSDKRLVRQVTLGQKAPNYWVPMDMTETECKIMEVRGRKNLIIL